MRLAPHVLVVASLLGSSALAAPGRLPLEAVPERYAITLAPHLDAGTFDGQERIALRVPKPTSTVTLNAADMTVTRASVGSDVAAIRLEGETLTLTFAKPLPAGAATLDLTWHAKLSDKLSGFYHAESEGRRYAFTDFEPTDARRAFPCFDEPALKARFTMTAVVDPAHLAVSNTPIASVKVEGGKKTVRFAETPRLSTYLVALAVGPLVESHTTAGKTQIRVITTPGKAALAKHALEYAAELLPWYEKYFGVPYAYGKLDLVAVPDFEAGAMENAGAIFFREAALLLDDQAAPQTQRRVAMIIAHEMAHQWFGDLVTMQWWDETWLNEAFATWAENRAEAALHPAWEPWLEFARGREGALATDALAATHPVHMPVANPEQAREAFDNITYEKGASVLRMLERWLGEENWRRGVSDYLHAHAEGNATGDDLWRALAAVSHQPVGEVARGWIDRAGHPLLTATARCNSGKTELVLAQTRDASATPPSSAKGGAPVVEPAWPIPVCARTPSTASCSLMRAATETRVVAPTCEPWALADADSGGFYRVRYDASTLAALGRAAEKSLQPVERVDLVADVWALVRDGRAPLVSYLDLVAELRGEPNDNVVQEVRRRLSRIGHELVAPADRERWRGFVSEVFGGALDELGWEAHPGESVERRQLRASLWDTLGDADVPSVLSASGRELSRYLGDPSSVDATLASTVVDLAARGGDAARWQSYRARMTAATTPEERQRFQTALTFFQAPALVEDTLKLTLTPEVRSQDAWRVLTSSLGHPWSRRATWSFVKTSWPALSAKVPENLLIRVVGAVGGFCDADLLKDALAFFGDKHLPGIKRRLAQAKEDVEECVAWKTRETAPLASWLRARGHKHAMR